MQAKLEEFSSHFVVSFIVTIYTIPELIRRVYKKSEYTKQQIIDFYEDYNVTIKEA